MTEKITLEEALKLVEFERGPEGWRIKCVKGTVWGTVWGDVRGDVQGNVRRDVEGSVRGDVWGDVGGNVEGTINGREWQFVETPREKLKRLIEEGADKTQLLEALNEMENSND